MPFCRSSLLSIVPALAVVAVPIFHAGSNAHAATRTRMDVRLAITDACLVQSLPESPPRVSCALNAAYRVVASQPWLRMPPDPAESPRLIQPSADKSLVEIQF